MQISLMGSGLLLQRGRLRHHNPLDCTPCLMHPLPAR